MCTEVYFKDYGKVVGNIGELAKMVGGFDRLSFDDDSYPTLVLERDANTCLCPIDVKAALEAGGFYFTQWEDAWDYTAWKPRHVIEQEQRDRDRARYEAAMAETRAAQGTEARRAETGTGSVHDGPVGAADAPA